jgi:hypothetical protein
MAYFENLTCGCSDCHYNHDHLCYRESIVLDLNGTCENMENCDDYECNDCEFFDFCEKRTILQHLLIPIISKMRLNKLVKKPGMTRIYLRDFLIYLINFI